jgi:hypothetical protein
MLVGHAPSLEACTRQLIGEQPRSNQEFVQVTRKVPFLSILQCERDYMGKWKLSPTPIPTMKHLELEEFDISGFFQNFTQQSLSHKAIFVPLNSYYQRTNSIKVF